MVYPRRANPLIGNRIYVLFHRNSHYRPEVYRDSISCYPRDRNERVFQKILAQNPRRNSFIKRKLPFEAEQYGILVISNLPIQFLAQLAKMFFR